MSTQATHFIGYGTLEELVKRQAEAMAHRAYASLSRSVDGSNPPSVTMVGQVEIVDDSGMVHYWRMKLARYVTFDGSAAFPEDLKRIDQARAGWQLVLDWLQAHDLAPVDAQVAAPKNLRLYEGSADFLRWSSERGWYRQEEA